MYVAMNRFRVVPGREAEFEEMWLNREVHLHKEEGFLAFHMLKGALTDDAEDPHRLYVSHTVWQTEDAFQAWLRSGSFRAAHAQAGRKPADSAPLTLGGPTFEGLTAIQSVASDGTVAYDTDAIDGDVTLDA